MVVLQKFGPHFGVPDPSPFVMKLETYLRLANIDYTPVNADLRKAPKGKLPCIEMDGKIIPDSYFAIEALKEKFGDPLASGLTELQLAQHHMFRVGLENHTYFMLFPYRWLHPQNAPTMQKAFFGKMGLPGKLIFKIVQRDMRRTVHGQGMLRHSWEEIDSMIAVDIKALETLLDKKPFFGGDEPKEIDATTFSYVANMLVPEIDTPFRKLALASRPLVDYHNRMTEKVFPDYKDTMII